MNKIDLAALQAKQLPRMSWTDVLQVKEGESLPATDVEALEKYFRVFVKPDGGCVGCGAQQGGNLVDALIGKARFTWGLTHGEGYCSECGYPARAYHRNVGPINFFRLILQYHPDELRKREAEAAA